MSMQPPRARLFTMLVGLVVFALSGLAGADPPSRVARLGYTAGAVSFSPAGENDWLQATINRPLTTGDRLWADAGARAEVQIGGAVIRMGAGTSVSLLNLDDRVAQLQLAQGTLILRVRRFGPDQVFEVDTPNLAFALLQPGEYRIEVDPDGNATTIIVRQGQGEVYGEGAAYRVDSGQSYRFMGTGLRDYQYADATRFDEFDRWSRDRDRREDNSVAARYVSPDVIGYEDLDGYGTWRSEADYGYVWVPNRVAAGWTPYRDGHWAWIDPWGWTWVDDAPWGFAVSHYGRWAYLGGTWGWVPGPVRSRAYYAPALVAFVGGSNFQLAISAGNVGGVAWFPLGPRDVYRPSYPVSRGYFDNINRSNTVINNTTINNVYNNTNVTNIVYANRQVQGAVVAVPTEAFVRSQPVSRAAVRVSPEISVGAPVSPVAAVTPVPQSVRGASRAGDKPPAGALERPVVARSTPPASRIGFAAQAGLLATDPGRPLDEAARRELKPAATAPTRNVRVVAPAQATPTTTPAPAEGPGRAAGDPRGTSGVPGTPMQRSAPPQITPAAPAAQPSEQRGQPEPRRQPLAAPQGLTPPPVAPQMPAAQPPEQRGRPEQRTQPAAPPTAPPQAVAPPRVAPPAPTAPPQAVAPPRVAPPAPTAQPPEQRGRPEQRTQPVAPPPTPPQVVAPPRVAPPAPAAQPPEPRGQPEQRRQPVAAPQGVAPSPVPAAQPPEQRGRPEQRMQPAAPPPAPPQAAAPPRAAPPAPPVPAAQPAPKVEQPGQQSQRNAGKPDDRRKDSEEQKREEEGRKPRP